VDVTFSTNRDGVSELVCDHLHNRRDVPLRLLGRRTRLAFTQCFHGKHRPRPGSKILRCKFVAGNRAKILVDIGRPDGPWLTRFIHILKQLVAWQVAQPPHDLREVGIFDADGVPAAAFSPKVEVHFRAGDLDMMIAEGRQPE